MVENPDKNKDNKIILFYVDETPQARV